MNSEGKRINNTDIAQLNRCLVELADILHIEPVKVPLAAGGA